MVPDGPTAHTLSFWTPCWTRASLIWDVDDTHQQ